MKKRENMEKIKKISKNQEEVKSQQKKGAKLNEFDEESNDAVRQLKDEIIYLRGYMNDLELRMEKLQIEGKVKCYSSKKDAKSKKNPILNPCRRCRKKQADKYCWDTCCFACCHGRWSFCKGHASKKRAYMRDS